MQGSCSKATFNGNHILFIVTSDITLCLLFLIRIVLLSTFYCWVLKYNLNEL